MIKFSEIKLSFANSFHLNLETCSMQITEGLIDITAF